MHVRTRTHSDLYREVASVDIVSQEEVASRFWGAPHVKELHEVVELAVDVATDCDWSFYSQHRLLLSQDLSPWEGGREGGGDREIREVYTTY